MLEVHVPDTQSVPVEQAPPVALFAQCPLAQLALRQSVGWVHTLL
jgi:hypothetical protein